MGYHVRTEFNKLILKISEKAEEVNVKGGYPHYGNVKAAYVLLKGSIPGPCKRLIRFNQATRPDTTLPKEAPSIIFTSLNSKQ